VINRKEIKIRQTADHNRQKQTKDPCGFQGSFSKPLWMDWAIDDSIRST